MIGLSWNCRGIGGASTVRDLTALVQCHHPQFVFLCETRQSAKKVSRLRSRLGLRGFCGIDSVGQSGGLTLFWNEQLSVEIKEKKERFIDAHIRASSTDPFWHLTCVYGEPRVKNRHLMWEKLQGLKTRSALPWCVIGDFSEAMWSFEYLSATQRGERQMLAFRDTWRYVSCQIWVFRVCLLPMTISKLEVGMLKSALTGQWRITVGGTSSRRHGSCTM